MLCMIKLVRVLFLHYYWMEFNRGIDMKFSTSHLTYFENRRLYQNRVGYFYSVWFNITVTRVRVTGLKIFFIRLSVRSTPNSNIQGITAIENSRHSSDSNAREIPRGMVASIYRAFTSNTFLGLMQLVASYTRN